VARCSIFADEEDCASFVALLRVVTRQRKWCCHAYCLMPNHYHAVIETELDRLSAGLHRLNGIHAQQFNARQGRVGHLFQDRFRAWLIESDEQLVNACTYVRNNPVRARLCASAEQWPWSGRIS
jgi:putative transposase